MRSVVTGSVLVVLAAAAGVGLWRTRDRGDAVQEATPAKKGKAAAPAPPRPRTVDQKPLTTARRLAALADTPEEVALARQAERLADHEVDLAYADLVRQLLVNPPALSEEAKVLAQAKAGAEATLEADQAQVKRLMRELSTAPEKAKDALEDQLEVAKAQVELDKDELASAADELERAGGDPQARIKRLKEAYEALQKGQAMVPDAPSTTVSRHSLLARFLDWRRQQHKQSELAAAQAELKAKMDRMTKRRADYQKRVEEARDDRALAKEKAASVAKQRTSREDTKDTLGELRKHMLDQRLVADMGRRLQDLQALTEVYGTWSGLAEGQGRVALHGLFRGLTWMAGILGFVFLVNRLLDVYYHRSTQGQRTASSVRTVVRISLQILAGLVCLLMALGLPPQFTTLLGLAGAGLTVALKDVILGFFGWFILQGRNGIRVGDWVEIKGVGGEVVEVGLLRTVLLETGSWADAGHPTGRRVTFANSFAVEGHYFNFSTSGKWMWDEVKVLIPPGQDPYPVIGGVQQLAERFTADNARLAEEEWRKETRRYRVQAFSAAPSLHVVPTSQGIEIQMRYITRAFERHDSRKALYAAVLELMHGRRDG